MRRRLLLVPAAAALLLVGAGAPASAHHPCYENEPCEGHWCIEPRFPLIVRC